MKLNQLMVPARDLARSIEFYRTLGFKLIVVNDHYARFEIGDGEVTFSLHLTDDVTGIANGPEIYFECEDLDARVAALKEKGVRFDTDPTDQSWGWREAHFPDPSGVKLCLYRAGEMRRFPPWRVKD